MRRRVFYSLLFFLLFRFAVADDKSRIIALENSWNQAELHNDAHAVDMLLADDFVMTVADGYTMDKAAMLASVRDTSYKPDVLQSENMQVHMYGNTAIVTGSYLEKGKDKGKDKGNRNRSPSTAQFAKARTASLRMTPLLGR